MKRFADIVAAAVGLIAAAAIAYGGWRAMQEEGTSFSEEADRFRGPDEGPSDVAPPPPSSPVHAAAATANAASTTAQRNRPAPIVSPLVGSSGVNPRRAARRL